MHEQISKLLTFHFDYFGQDENTNRLILSVNLETENVQLITVDKIENCLISYDTFIYIRTRRKWVYPIHIGIGFVKVILKYMIEFSVKKIRPC